MSRYYDYNVIVIGAGSGGLVAAVIAAATRAGVALIEREAMGGDCLNTGCVPSKALIKAANTAHTIRTAGRFGIHAPEPDIDFSAVMNHVRRSIETIAPHDSVERFTELGVDCFQADAFIEDPHHVRAGDKILSCRSIIVASGARPAVPSLPGIDSIDYLTSDSLWQLTSLPKKLLVVGGGPIGCEMAQAFSRLGSSVTIVDRNSRLLKTEDHEVGRIVQQQFEDEGIDVRCNWQLQGFEKSADEQRAQFSNPQGSQNIGFDKVLIALGRQANIEGFGLQQLAVEIDDRQRIAADGFMRTNIDNIYVCGDVTGPYQYTHAAGHQAWYACVNALFSPLKKFTVDYSAMAHCTFSSPQVARVGLNQQLADQQGTPFELSRYQLSELDRAICEGAYMETNAGFIEVLTKPGSDKILGATIVGEQAGELIAEFILAKQQGLGLNKILSTLHIYPSWSDANKQLAGVWRRAHTPRLALWLLEKFHHWRRKH